MQQRDFRQNVNRKRQKCQKEFQEESKKCEILFKVQHLVAAWFNSLEKNVDLYNCVTVKYEKWWQLEIIYFKVTPLSAIKIYDYIC